MADAEAALRKARTNPTSVEELDLNGAALAALPPEVFACTRARTLNLFRALAPSVSALPDELARLTKLEELSLGGLAFADLPAWIAQLKKLRRLSLAYCGALAALPDAVGDLAALEELELDWSESLATLPRALARLPKLRRLTLARTAVTEVPRDLWKVRSLRELVLPTELEKLPPGIGALDKLEALTLSASALASIAKELPKLKGVRSLRIEGATKKLPEEVGALAALRRLDVAFLGLTTLPASLSKLERLQELDVSGNALGELASVIAPLPRLTQLSFADNAFERAETKRVEEMMKLPPKERARSKGATAPPPAPATKRRAAKAKAPASEPPAADTSNASKATPLGTMGTANDALTLLFADSGVAKEWRGGANAARVEKALAGGKDAGRIDVAGRSALLVALGQGHGVVNVYQSATGAIVLVEGFVQHPRDAAYLAYVAAAPSARAREGGRVVVETDGHLAVLPASETTKQGLAIALSPGRYKVLLEPPSRGAWGSARRALVVPA